jgi:hypothetical protein
MKLPFPVIYLNDRQFHRNPHYAGNGLPSALDDLLLLAPGVDLPGN